jgi:hypothetical protein
VFRIKDFAPQLLKAEPGTCYAVHVATSQGKHVMNTVCTPERTDLYRRLRNLRRELDTCRSITGEAVIQMHALRIKMEVNRVERELRGR